MTRRPPAATPTPAARAVAAPAGARPWATAAPHPAAMPDACQPRWYCVHTKPRAEALALQQLQRQGFHAFLPRTRVLRLRNGRRVRGVEPLFPRYLFLRVQPQIESLAPVRSTRGVLGLVRFGERIAEVPTALVERLAGDADADGLIECAAGAPRPGDRVRILEGPLLGLEAIYRSQDGASRAVILLTLLGRDQQIRIPTRTLERLASSP